MNTVTVVVSVIVMVLVSVEMQGEAWMWVTPPHLLPWRPPRVHSPNAHTQRGTLRIPPRHLPSNPRPGLLSSLGDFLDPLNLFTARESAPERRVLGAARVGEAGQSVPTTEPPPPIVYFPEGGDGQCQDFAPAGFNTYSFLSFLFAVVNLVGNVVNNVNNNINNDNNNNDNNNNNLNNINVADSNSNINNDNTVTIPPAMGGRRRRRRRRRGQDHAILDQHDGCRLVKEEVEAALVAVDFLRGVRTAMVSLDPACDLRNMCEVNRAATGRGELGGVMAEVLSQALVESYPRHLPPGGGVALFSAATNGRQGVNCSSAYPACPDITWLHHLSLLDLVARDLGTNADLVEIIKENSDLGLPDLTTILDLTSRLGDKHVLSDQSAE